MGKRIRLSCNICSYQKQEIKQLHAEIDRIASTTTFNELKVFNSQKADAVSFTKSLVNAIGSGTGSIASPSGLAGDKASLLNGSSTSDYFVLNVDEDKALLLWSNSKPPGAYHCQP